MAEEPRLMTRSEAAAYCRFSTGQFSRLVSAGILPQAVPGMRRWDRKALDICLDKLSGIPDANAPEDAFDKWEREYDARKAMKKR